MSDDTDRIVKTTVLGAPRERVWRAISDAKEFGSWFGMDLDEPFVAGTRVTGRIAPTKVDAAVAKLQEPHAGTALELAVERVEPMSLLSFRWHAANVDASQATLVTFELEDAPGGTRLTITESGFDRIPLERRAEMLKGNEDGWSMQIVLIAKYLQ